MMVAEELKYLYFLPESFWFSTLSYCSLSSSSRSFSIRSHISETCFKVKRACSFLGGEALGEEVQLPGMELTAVSEENMLAGNREVSVVSVLLLPDVTRLRRCKRFHSK